jgi:hypothetical protein
MTTAPDLPQRPDTLCRPPELQKLRSSAIGGNLKKPHHVPKAEPAVQAMRVGMTTDDDKASRVIRVMQHLS